MPNYIDKACRIIAEHFFDDETLDLVGRVLALEDDERVAFVELDIEKTIYAKPKIHAEVKLKKAFKNQQDFRDYLERHNLPTQDAYQYCQNSQALDYPDENNRTVSVHFSQPDFRR